jgi:hypothetical protein
MSAAWAKLGVDILIVAHLLFVVFVLAGGLLLLKWRSLAWLHVPAVIWAMLVELNGWLCPLTPLENELRRQAGLGLYQGDFVMHYLMPVLYPVDLTRTLQVAFGIIVVLLNLGVYFYVFKKRPRAG